MYENTCFDRFKMLPDFESSIPCVMKFVTYTKIGYTEVDVADFYSADSKTSIIIGKKI